MAIFLEYDLFKLTHLGTYIQKEVDISYVLNIASNIHPENFSTYENLDIKAPFRY